MDAVPPGCRCRLDPVDEVVKAAALEVATHHEHGFCVLGEPELAVALQLQVDDAANGALGRSTADRDAFAFETWVPHAVCVSQDAWQFRFPYYKNGVPSGKSVLVIEEDPNNTKSTGNNVKLD